MSSKEATNASAQQPAYMPERTLICTAITASTMEQFLADIDTVTAAGVDLIELRLDYIGDFSPEKDLDTLMSRCTIPYIVTYRPQWEG
jgi:3-dehydroquinate dehydratase / shikimate dehydrogenase